jgi:hypothetical protein
MAHYAKVLSGKVIKVIVANEQFFTTFIDTEPGDWVQTSYNTRHNQHSLSGTPLRGNFAGIGYTYDSINDVFIPPKTYNSWVLNTQKWDWEAPVAEPTDGKKYSWNESTTSWDVVAEPS